MKALSVIFGLIIVCWSSEYKFNRVAYLPQGLGYGGLACGDTDHNGLSEIIFRATLIDINEQALEIYEFQNDNSYTLVRADTGNDFAVWDAGDVDGDGLTDLLGCYFIYPSWRARILESPNPLNYPSVVSWEFGPLMGYGGQPLYFADLNQDSDRNIIFIANDLQTIFLFKNVGDNQNNLVFCDTLSNETIYAIATGDFDGDGLQEFVTSGAGSGNVFVYENTSDDSYAMTLEDNIPLTNGLDVFSGNDTDQDGKPEFFINYASVSPLNVRFYLYRFEASGDNTYEHLLIDSISRTGDFRMISDCGDVDGDGIEEIVWSIGSAITVLKATGNDHYERVWQWENDHKVGAASATVRCYDLNHNGYDEIVVSGNERTSVFEYDTTTAIQEPTPTPIQVLSLTPNPFRQTITLSYSLSQAGPVELRVYDLSGRCIKTLLATQRLEPGVYSVTWDGKADNGLRAVTGVYFYRLETMDYKSTKKVVRLK